MTSLIFCLAPIFICLLLIRDIRLVTYVASFGNAVYFVSFIIIFQFVVQDSMSIEILPLVVHDVEKWMRAIGVASFALEGKLISSSSLVEHNVETLEVHFIIDHHVGPLVITVWLWRQYKLVQKWSISGHRF